MKKSFILFIFLSLILLTLTGCNSNSSQSQSQSQSQSSSKTPDTSVSSFLDDMQHENYSSAKKYYVENLDNMANFRNQLEQISPSVANELFSKVADFSYTIEDYMISKEDPSKATVYVTMNYYDVGKAFETTLVDYVKNDLEMTFDGKNDDDIIKKADAIISENIKSSQKITTNRIPVQLTLEKDTWKLEKIIDNPDFLNALSGNLLYTLESLETTLENLDS